MNKHGGYFGGNADSVIDFSVNVNPLGISPKLVESLKKNLEDIVRYPEIDGETGKNLLSKTLDIHINQIILGNGATELIYLFAKAIKPNKVLIVEPTFTEYRRAFEINGSSIYQFVVSRNKDFNMDIDDLLNEIKFIQPDVLVICNPNNPTGGFIEKEKIKAILETLNKMQSFLFIDESFIDFTNKDSCKEYISKYPLFILRSMTKFYAIAGLRLGYGLAHKDLTAKLNIFKEPWTVNSLALQSIPVLLDDKEYKEMTLKWLQEEKDFLFRELTKLNYLKVFKSSSNFFLCMLTDGDAEKLQNYLLEQGIYIRTCEDFYGLSNSYFRIAVRTHDENLMLINILKKLK